MIGLVSSIVNVATYCYIADNNVLFSKVFSGLCVLLRGCWRLVVRPGTRPSKRDRRAVSIDELPPPPTPDNLNEIYSEAA